MTQIKKYDKLNLGCGDYKYLDYLNLDLYNTNADIMMDMTDLDFVSNSVSEMVSVHSFEHLSHHKVSSILSKWYEILKPGGKLIIEIPDILEICRQFEFADKEKRNKLIHFIYGTDQKENSHLFGWYNETIFELLSGVGFTDININEAVGWLEASMKIECRKPFDGDNQKPLIYDCFMFFNELDILEIRLNELNDVVDYFVLVEGTKTISNNPKPLYFDENKARFAKFLPKIIHVIVDDFSDNGSSWDFEEFQRNAIGKGLNNCKDNDIIIVSDVDEIPSLQSVKEYNIDKGQGCFMQKFSYYYLNCIRRGEEEIWAYSKILPYKYFVEIGGAQGVRKSYPDFFLENGGWHFSFIGDTDNIIAKIESYSHQEFNRDDIKNKERLRLLRERGLDLFGRQNYNYRFESLDNSYPNFVLDNQEKYSEIIKK